MRLHSSGVVIFAVLVGGSLLAMPGQSPAATAQATVNSISSAGIGSRLGTVIFSDNAGGLLITPKLSGLPPVSTGFTFTKKAIAVRE